MQSICVKIFFEPGSVGGHPSKEIPWLAGHGCAESRREWGALPCPGREAKGVRRGGAFIASTPTPPRARLRAGRRARVC